MARVLRVSAARVDRLLSGSRPAGSGGRDPGSDVRPQVLLRERAATGEEPGWMQADTVRHCGEGDQAAREAADSRAQRLLASPAVSQESKERLRRRLAETDPVAMRHEIDQERRQLLLLLREFDDSRAPATWKVAKMPGGGGRRQIWLNLVRPEAATPVYLNRAACAPPESPPRSRHLRVSF